MPDTADALVLELEDLGRRLTAIDPTTSTSSPARSTRSNGPNARTRHWRRVTVWLRPWPRRSRSLVLVIPPARHAVADLFGIGGERITRTSSLPSNLGTRFDLGRSIDVDDARRNAPAPIATPDRIGAPDAAFAGRPAGGTSFVWEPSAQLPRVFDSDIGLLLTEFPGRARPRTVREGGAARHDDRAGHGRRCRRATGSATACTSSSISTRDGKPQPDTARLAANTLLWERDGVTYRLESALDRDAALALARQLTPAR